MTSERLLNMSIEVLYLPKYFYAPSQKNKQISGYAPAADATQRDSWVASASAWAVCILGICNL